MHRASSTGRFSDEYYNNNHSPSSTSPLQAPRTSSSELPSYNPDSIIGKKERSRLRYAQNAIHLIPLVLVLCAIILWFCSKPVDIINKGDSIVPRIKGLTIDGNPDSGGIQSSLLTKSNLEEFDSKKASRFKSTRLLGRKLV